MKQGKQQIILLSILVVTLILFLFPLYVGVVGSTHSIGRLQQSPLPIIFGSNLFANFEEILLKSINLVGVQFYTMFNNSLILGIGIAFGKIITAILAAYALVFFRFPFRKLSFWFILLTLMLPVETRIFSTYRIMNLLQLSDTYSGLILPLIGSATATFFFRQYFTGIPDELCEAAQIDGVSPLLFFIKILLPLSKTALACIFVLMFIFGWNQYLWPILVTNKPTFYTIFIGIKKMLSTEGEALPWNIVLLISSISMVLPVIVLFSLQKAFIAFMIDYEK